VSAGTTWALIGACAVVTAALKAVGPVALGGRALPLWFTSIVALMGPALFAALVVTQVLADGKDLGVGADTAGVALAGVAAWRTYRLRHLRGESGRPAADHASRRSTLVDPGFRPRVQR
jgi:branched-subunit amino acid transport protein